MGEMFCAIVPNRRFTFHHKIFKMQSTGFIEKVDGSD